MISSDNWTCNEHFVDSILGFHLLHFAPNESHCIIGAYSIIYQHFRVLIVLNWKGDVCNRWYKHWIKTITVRQEDIAFITIFCIKTLLGEERLLYWTFGIISSGHKKVKLAASRIGAYRVIPHGVGGGANEEKMAISVSYNKKLHQRAGGGWTVAPPPKLRLLSADGIATKAKFIFLFLFSGKCTNNARRAWQKNL